MSSTVHGNRCEALQWSQVIPKFQNSTDKDSEVVCAALLKIDLYDMLQLAVQKHAYKSIKDN